LAGVWTLDGEAKVLELKASAGSCTHLSETHRRVALGQGEIGLIAAERRTHVTSAILQDPRMGDPAWARGEGLVAFVGHPLLEGSARRRHGRVRASPARRPGPRRLRVG